MASTGDDERRPAQPPSDTRDPPFQALTPNLDKISRDAFRKGTVSRRRINISLVVFAGAVVVTAALVIATIL